MAYGLYILYTILGENKKNLWKFSPLLPFLIYASKYLRLFIHADIAAVHQNIRLNGEV